MTSTITLCRTLPSSQLEHGRQTSTTAKPPKTEYLIKVPDFPNTSINRARAQDAHAKEVKPLVDSGHLTLGSVLLREHPKAGEKPSIVGSIIILKAESEHAVREVLRNDVYATSGVWDVDSAEIWPIETGIRSAL